MKNLVLAAFFLLNQTISYAQISPARNAQPASELQRVSQDLRAVQAQLESEHTTGQLLSLLAQLRQINLDLAHLSTQFNGHLDVPALDLANKAASDALSAALAKIRQDAIQALHGDYYADFHSPDWENISSHWNQDQLPPPVLQDIGLNQKKSEVKQLFDLLSALQKPGLDPAIKKEIAAKLASEKMSPSEAIDTLGKLGTISTNSRALQSRLKQISQSLASKSGWVGNLDRGTGGTIEGFQSKLGMTRSFGTSGQNIDTPGYTKPLNQITEHMHVVRLDALNIPSPISASRKALDIASIPENWSVQFRAAAQAAISRTVFRDLVKPGPMHKDGKMYRPLGNGCVEVTDDGHPWPKTVYCRKQGGIIEEDFKTQIAADKEQKLSGESSAASILTEKAWQVDPAVLAALKRIKDPEKRNQRVDKLGFDIVYNQWIGAKDSCSYANMPKGAQAQKNSTQGCDMLYYYAKSCASFLNKWLESDPDAANSKIEFTQGHVKITENKPKGLAPGAVRLIEGNFEATWSGLQDNDRYASGNVGLGIYTLTAMSASGLKDSTWIRQSQYLGNWGREDAHGAEVRSGGSWITGYNATETPQFQRTYLDSGATQLVNKKAVVLFDSGGIATAWAEGSESTFNGARDLIAAGGAKALQYSPAYLWVASKISGRSAADVFDDLGAQASSNWHNNSYVGAFKNAWLGVAPQKSDEYYIGNLQDRLTQEGHPVAGAIASGMSDTGTSLLQMAFMGKSLKILGDLGPTGTMLRTTIDGYYQIRLPADAMGSGWELYKNWGHWDTKEGQMALREATSQFVNLVAVPMFTPESLKRGEGANEPGHVRAGTDEYGRSRLEQTLGRPLDWLGEKTGFNSFMTDAGRDFRTASRDFGGDKSRTGKLLGAYAEGFLGGKFQPAYSSKPSIQTTSTGQRFLFEQPVQPVQQHLFPWMEIPGTEKAHVGTESPAEPAAQKPIEEQGALFPQHQQPSQGELFPVSSVVASVEHSISNALHMPQPSPDGATPTTTAKILTFPKQDGSASSIPIDDSVRVAGAGSSNDATSSSRAIPTYEGSPTEKLADIEPIKQTRGQYIYQRKDIAGKVEKPLVVAAEIFYDKNIRTEDSSANKNNVAYGGHYAGFGIDARDNNLSQENINIALNVIPNKYPGVKVNFYEDSGRVLGIHIPIDENTSAKDLSAKAAQIASEFKPQEMNWVQAPTIEQLAQIYASKPAQIKKSLKSDGHVDGWIYDPETQRFFRNQEQIGKFKEGQLVGRGNAYENAKKLGADIAMQHAGVQAEHDGTLLPMHAEIVQQGNKPDCAACAIINASDGELGKSDLNMVKTALGPNPHPSDVDALVEKLGGREVTLENLLSPVLNERKPVLVLINAGEPGIVHAAVVDGYITVDGTHYISMRDSNAQHRLFMPIEDFEKALHGKPVYFPKPADRDVLAGHTPILDKKARRVDPKEPRIGSTQSQLPSQYSPQWDGIKQDARNNGQYIATPGFAPEAIVDTLVPQEGKRAGKVSPKDLISSMQATGEPVLVTIADGTADGKQLLVGNPFIHKDVNGGRHIILETYDPQSPGKVGHVPANDIAGNMTKDGIALIHGVTDSSISNALRNGREAFSPGDRQWLQSFQANTNDAFSDWSMESDAGKRAQLLPKLQQNLNDIVLKAAQETDPSKSTLLAQVAVELHSNILRSKLPQETSLAVNVDAILAMPGISRAAKAEFLKDIYTRASASPNPDVSGKVAQILAASVPEATRPASVKDWAQFEILKKLAENDRFGVAQGNSHAHSALTSMDPQAWQQAQVAARQQGNSIETGQAQIQMPKQTEGTCAYGSICNLFGQEIAAGQLKTDDVMTLAHEYNPNYRAADTRGLDWDETVQMAQRIADKFGKKVVLVRPDLIPDFMQESHRPVLIGVRADVENGKFHGHMLVVGNAFMYSDAQGQPHAAFETYDTNNHNTGYLNASNLGADMSHLGIAVIPKDTSDRFGVTPTADNIKSPERINYKNPPGDGSQSTPENLQNGKNGLSVGPLQTIRNILPQWLGGTPKAHQIVTAPETSLPPDTNSVTGNQRLPQAPHGKDSLQGRVEMHANGQTHSLNFVMDRPLKISEATGQGVLDDGRRVAIKAARRVGDASPVDMTEMQNETLNEARLLREVSAQIEHNGASQDVHVPKVLGIGYIDPKTAHAIYGQDVKLPVLIMEESQGTNLAAWEKQGKKISEKDWTPFAKGVLALHNASPENGFEGIIHGDIQAEHILISEDPQTGRQHFTLLDFGGARRKSDVKTKSGTLDEDGFKARQLQDMYALYDILHRFKEKGLLESQPGTQPGNHN